MAVSFLTAVLVTVVFVGPAQCAGAAAGKQLHIDKAATNGLRAHTPLMLSRINHAAAETIGHDACHFTPVHELHTHATMQARN